MQGFEVSLTLISALGISLINARTNSPKYGPCINPYSFKIPELNAAVVQSRGSWLHLLNGYIRTLHRGICTAIDAWLMRSSTLAP